jgi:hypothetical protein
VGWTNGASGSNNPLAFTLQTNVSVQAMFAESLTTNHTTPHWWLAVHGITSDFENAVNTLGANGLPLWQSYIAGLNPTSATSQLKLMASGNVLRWSTTVGRVYNLEWSTNITGPFVPVPGALNLPDTVTNLPTPSSGAASTFYRIEAQLP